MTGLLSNRGRVWKLAVLALAAVGLMVWSEWFFPAPPPQHIRARLWRENPQAWLGSRVKLVLAPIVAGDAQSGLVVEVDSNDHTVKLIGPPGLLAGGRPGGRLDVIGRLEGPTTIRAEKVRIYRGPRGPKVWGSLAAALAVVGLFFWCFRFDLGNGSLFRSREET